MRRLLLATALVSTVSLSACNLESQARVDSIHRMNEGIKLYKKNQMSGAETALKEATQIDPTNHKAWDALGTLYRRAERWGDAEEAYQNAIKNMGDENLNIGAAISLRAASCTIRKYSANKSIA